MNISFICRTISIEEIIRCSFNLNKTEYSVFYYLLKTNKKKTVKEIGHTIGLKRTSVQKALSSLLKKNLIKRTQKNLKNGGYVYLYQLVSKKQIKQRIKQSINDWVKKVNKSITKI